MQHTEMSTTNEQHKKVQERKLQKIDKHTKKTMYKGPSHTTVPNPNIITQVKIPRIIQFFHLKTTHRVNQLNAAMSAQVNRLSNHNLCISQAIEVYFTSIQVPGSNWIHENKSTDFVLR